MQKMYHLLCERRKTENMPEGIYFYTSRKAAVMTCINNEAYINMLIDISSGMTPKKLMKERFGLTPAQILPFDPQKYDIIHKYVWAHAEAIFKRSEEAKQTGTEQALSGICFSAFISGVGTSSECGK